MKLYDTGQTRGTGFDQLWGTSALTLDLSLVESDQTGGLCYIMMNHGMHGPNGGNHRQNMYPTTASAGAAAGMSIFMTDRDYMHALYQQFINHDDHIHKLQRSVDEQHRQRDEIQAALVAEIAVTFEEKIENFKAAADQPVAQALATLDETTRTTVNAAVAALDKQVELAVNKRMSTAVAALDKQVDLAVQQGVARVVTVPDEKIKRAVHQQVHELMATLKLSVREVQSSIDKMQGVLEKRANDKISEDSGKQTSKTTFKDDDLMAIEMSRLVDTVVDAKFRDVKARIDKAIETIDGKMRPSNVSQMLDAKMTEILVEFRSKIENIDKDELLDTKRAVDACVATLAQMQQVHERLLRENMEMRKSIDRLERESKKAQDAMVKAAKKRAN